MSTVQPRPIENTELSKSKIAGRNARIHSKENIVRIANSIEKFGFTNPILIDANTAIMGGHARLVAAKELGLSTVPCVRPTKSKDSSKRDRE